MFVSWASVLVVDMAGDSPCVSVRKLVSRLFVFDIGVYFVVAHVLCACVCIVVDAVLVYVLCCVYCGLRVGYVWLFCVGVCAVVLLYVFDMVCYSVCVYMCLVF